MDIAKVESRFADPMWRLDNLYSVVDKRGVKVPFRCNAVQRSLLGRLHYFNVILKARQLGMTTLIDLYMLDSALFNSNQHCGVVAQGLTEATDLFENKVKFAYENLDESIKRLRPLVSDSARKLEFSNGSSMTVGTSMRSGTMQKLHISEYGPLAARYPEKAKEIKTGAFNTVDSGQQIFVESTAAGMQGEFYDLVSHARRLEDGGKGLTPLDPKFHFYPWHMEPAYMLAGRDLDGIVLTSEDEGYFAGLPVMLTFGQKAWYTKKAALMGEEMKREFPSTPEEAFSASVEGAYYEKQMRGLRKSGQITRVRHDPAFPVQTFWDLGKSKSDYMSIWFMQHIGREYRFIRYMTGSGEGFPHYWREMQKFGYTYGTHYFPHDGDHNQHTPEGLMTQKQIAEDIGIFPVKVVKRTQRLQTDIQICRNTLPLCVFDETNAAEGIACLDNYRKTWDDTLGKWRDEPRHDENSHGADSWRTFAMALYNGTYQQNNDIDDGADYDYTHSGIDARNAISGY